MTATVDREAILTTEAPAFKKSRVLLIAGILAMVVGFGAMAGGAFGAWYTWDQAAAQSIVTPDDAAIPGAAVRGPFTMWAQSDIINHHQLESTDGLYYSQMDRVVPQIDDNGSVVLDENGEAVMVPNQARASWITATTLTTALNLGVMAYALAAFAFVVGLVLAFTGYVFFYIRRSAVIL